MKIGFRKSDAHARYWDKVWNLASINAPLHESKPTIWFVRPDLFDSRMRGETIERSLAVMGKCLRHVFIVITDYPERLESILQNSEFLSNVFIGVMVEKQFVADARLPLLRRVAN